MTLFKHLVMIAVSIGLTALSYETGFQFHWITEVNPLEAFSVFTSYWCTILCVFQTRWNYPIGAVSVAALCLLFYNQSLYASMALQVYLFPALAFGFWRWRRDDNSLPVSLVDLSWWPAYIGLTALVGVVLACINIWIGGANPFWDTSIMVLSILGQFLLDNKKLENWIVWIVVDIISVFLYWHQGLCVLSIQMGLFGLNALWGLYMWHKNDGHIDTYDFAYEPTHMAGQLHHD